MDYFKPLHQSSCIETIVFPAVKQGNACGLEWLDWFGWLVVESWKIVRFSGTCGAYAAIYLIFFHYFLRLLYQNLFAI